MGVVLLATGDGSRFLRGATGERAAETYASEIYLDLSRLTRLLVVLRPMATLSQLEPKSGEFTPDTCFVWPNGDEPAARVFIAAAGAGHGRGRAA